MTKFHIKKVGILFEIEILIKLYIMSYRVTEVIDGDTFTVSPNWHFNSAKGDTVRIAGLDAPELDKPGGQAAKRKLQELIGGKEVELRNKVNLSYGRLVCDVFLNGRNIIDLL